MPKKKFIVSSKSFGLPVTNLEGLAEALSAYTARAVDKLRQQKKV